MRRLARTTAMTVGIAATLIGGGSVVAGAWTVGGHRGTATARSASVPAVNRPTATPAGRSVVIRWTGLRLLPGVPATGYRVIRHGSGESVLVCEAGRRIRRCADVPPRDGSWTYTVRATFHRWAGPHSEPTGPITRAEEQKVSATGVDGATDAGPLILPEPEPSGPSAEPTPSAPVAVESAEPTSGAPQATAEPTDDPPAAEPAPEDAERAPRRGARDADEPGAP